MPRGPKTPPAENKPGRTPQTAVERALDGVRKAYQKYDQTQDRAIDADKRAGELWEETKYLRRVFLHAGAHPDLPDDFNAEQFIADEQAGQTPAEPEPEPAPPVQPTPVEPDPTPVEPDPTPVVDDDDPFANVG